MAIQIEPLGLKTLTDSDLNSPTASKFSASSSSSSPPTWYSSSEEEEEEEEEENVCWGSYGRSAAHKFPPAIPLLARTANLSGHMPWVLQRTYKDGRLVIREVPVKHHEYFRTRRENGRLRLQLVRLDGYVSKINRAPEEEAAAAAAAAQKYVASPLMMLPSSMPEPTCKPERTKMNSRMRAVRI